MDTFENDGEIPPAIRNAALKYQTSVASIINTLNNHGFGYDLNQDEFEITLEMDSILEDEYSDDKFTKIKQDKAYKDYQLNTEKLINKRNDSVQIDNILESSETLEPSTIDKLAGTYKKGNLTLVLGSELLPKNEDLAIIFHAKEEEITNDEYFLEIAHALNIDAKTIQNSLQKVFSDDLNWITTYDVGGKPIVLVAGDNVEGNLTRILNQKYLDSISSGHEIEEIKNIFIPITFYPFNSFELHYLSAILDHVTNLNLENHKHITLSYSKKIRFSIDPNKLKEWTKIDSLKSKIDFHLDDPALEDKLGRRPIARSLARLVNNDIFATNKKFQSAFMIHLQGKWGEGKTSFMNFLEDELRATSDEDWIVIKYNAWKNQHINPPWWSFIDSLYQQGKENFNGLTKSKIVFDEFFRRLNHKTLLSLIFSGFILLGLLQVLEWLKLSFNSIATIEILLTVFTFGATIFALGKNGSGYFLTNTPESVRFFINRTEDPTAYIKKHFKELHYNISRAKKGTEDQQNRIAFFIDDLDRCNAQFVVKLLEGIQTLFRDQPVLYLVAADKDWISKSFETVYTDYRSIASDNGSSLGNFFVEKNFQLSVRLPNPSKDQVDKYWDFILNKNSIEKNSSPENRKELLQELQNKGKQKLISGEKTINDLADQFDISIEETQNLVLDNFDETDEDIRHLLQEYSSIVGTNARTIKRIANQYTIFRNLILIEQNKVDQVKLFRWVALLNRFPLFIDAIIETGINNIESFSNSTFMNGRRLTPYTEIIEHIVGKGEEKLTQKDAEIFLGVEKIFNQ